MSRTLKISLKAKNGSRGDPPAFPGPRNWVDRSVQTGGRSGERHENRALRAMGDSSPRMWHKDEHADGAWIDHVRREEGSVLLVALIVLVLLTILGIAASKTSDLELGMAANWQFQKEAFYAAESAASYVAESPELYDNHNISAGEPESFSSSPAMLGNAQSFSGSVQYLGISAPPRGSGFETGTFKAYKYKMECDGRGPSGARARVEAGFYRVGF